MQQISKFYEKKGHEQHYETPEKIDQLIAGSSLNGYYGRQRFCRADGELDN